MLKSPYKIDPGFEWGFDLQARQPRHLEYKARWRDESAATLSRLACLRDIPCGDHTDQCFDIYPCGRRPAPCLIFLHGGFWRSSDKSEIAFVANAFARFGITSVLMNYRLAPAVSVSGIVDELQHSVADLFRRAEELNIDQSRIFVGGFSAGGLLAAHVLGTDWARHGLSTQVVRAGMALSGIFDPKPVVFTSHNKVLGLNPSEARALCVIGPYDENTPKLSLVACGMDETPIFREQTERYVKSAKGAGQKTRDLWIDGRHHYDVILEFANPDSALSVATRRLICSHT